MAEKIQLEVVTPERRVLAEPVDMVTVPGLGGELGILPGHTPLISQLQTGVLTYVQEGKSYSLHVSGGFVEVRDDHVSVLADVAERRFFGDVHRLGHGFDVAGEAVRLRAEGMACIVRSPRLR